jgi:hypothetical protein
VLNLHRFRSDMVLLSIFKLAFFLVTTFCLLERIICLLVFPFPFHNAWGVLVPDYTLAMFQCVQV